MAVNQGGYNLDAGRTGLYGLTWKNSAALPNSSYKRAYFLTVPARTAYLNDLLAVYPGLDYTTLDWPF